MKQNRVGLVEVLLGILDWRAGGRQGLCNQMKWNESEAAIGRVLAVEVTVSFFLSLGHHWIFFSSIPLYLKFVLFLRGEIMRFDAIEKNGITCKFLSADDITNWGLMYKVDFALVSRLT